MSPGVAKIMAREGLSKRDVQQYIFKNTKIVVRNLCRHAYELGYTSYDLQQLHDEGMISSAYVESDDLDRRVPVFIKPEAIGIVLCGAPGRNQSKGFVQNQSHGYPTGKMILLPADWNSMIEKK